MLRELAQGPLPSIAELMPELPSQLADLIVRSLVIDRAARLGSLRVHLPVLAALIAFSAVTPGRDAPAGSAPSR